VISGLTVAGAIGVITMMFMRSKEPSGWFAGGDPGTDDGCYWRAALVGLAIVGATAITIAVSPVSVNPSSEPGLAREAILPSYPGSPWRCPR
jgi:hypothetical protein